MFDDDFIKTTLTPILAIVGAIFGLIGTGLGVVNFMLTWRSHRVKLKAKASYSQHLSHVNELAFGERHFELHEMTLIIHAINKSYFELTVDEVGVVIKEAWYKRRGFIPLGANLRDNGRLESRGSTTFRVGAKCHSTSMRTKLYLLAQNPDKPLSKIGRGVYFKVVTGNRGIGGKAEFLEFSQRLEAWVPIHFGEIEKGERHDAPAPEEPPTDAG